VVFLMGRCGDFGNCFGDVSKLLRIVLGCGFFADFSGEGPFFAELYVARLNRRHRNEEGESKSRSLASLGMTSLFLWGIYVARAVFGERFVRPGNPLTGGGCALRVTGLIRDDEFDGDEGGDASDACGDF
jgi:hypothetical protein